MSSEEKIFRGLCMLFGLTEISHSVSLGDEPTPLLKFVVIHPEKRFLLEIPKRDLFACKDDFEAFVMIGNLINQSLQ